MTADLLRQLRVERDAEPGSYRAEVSGDWSIRGPSGGVLAAVALSAAREELAEPEFFFRSCTATFTSVIGVGPVRLRVETLRKGRAAAQLSVDSRAERSNEEGLRVVATLARKRSGVAVADARYPDVPGPEGARAHEHAVPFRANVPLRFFENFELKLALGAPWWRDDWQPSEARLARWFRYRTPPLRDGALDPLALLPIADTMPPALIQHLGPGFEPFIAPSLDLTVHWLSAPLPGEEWLLADSRVRWAGDGYAEGRIDIWSDRQRLLASGSQMMILRRVPPELRG